MRKRTTTKRAKSKKSDGRRQQAVPYRSDNAALLEDLDRQRYIELLSKAQRTDAEEQERWHLVEKADAHRCLLARFQAARPHIGRLENALRAKPDDPALQQEYLRAWVAPCYHKFDSVLLSWQMQGKHPFLLQNPARSGLETVLHFMDSTIMTDELRDPERRIRFLYGVHTMLEPFRKLKNGQKLDLLKAFEFTATGSGNKPKEETDKTLEYWGTPCFDEHLLRMAGIRPVQANARVAAVHGRETGALRSAYKKWSEHPVRAEVLRQGDEHAKAMLACENLRALIGTAFPPLAKEHRAHRPRQF